MVISRSDSMRFLKKLTGVNGLYSKTWMWTIGSIFIPGSALADIQYNPVIAWNLLGNSSSQPIDVASYFGDPTKVTTVWKWNRTGGKWAFYSPKMNSTDLATYIASKGYDALTSIDPKEGFWLNATAAFNVTVPTVSAAILNEPDLQLSWNLTASADNKTPSDLNLGLKTSLNAAGKTAVTFWAWTGASWKFYAPALDTAAGGLTSYIASKGYLPFSAPLSSSEGFWVNVGTSSGSTSLFTAPANPLNLNLTLDATTTSVSTLVTSVGPSTLKTTATDGTIYQLDIPDGALSADTQITMIPVASVAKLPLSGGLGGAVKFEPEGLSFIKSATLTITPAVAIPAVNQIVFGFTGIGEDTIVAAPGAGIPIQISVSHFSGAGVGNGTSSDKANILNSIATRVEARLESEVGSVLTDKRNGLSTTDAMTRLVDLLTEYENSVVKNRITAAGASGASCANAQIALTTLRGYERQRGLLGLPQSGAWSRQEEALNNVKNSCRPPKVDECKKLKDPKILLNFDLIHQRERVLAGFPEDDFPLQKLASYDQVCLGTGWVATTKSVGGDPGSGIQWEYNATVNFVVDPATTTGNTLGFKAFAGNVFGTIPSGPVNGCSLSGASNSSSVTEADGKFTIDLFTNTYTGSGIVDASRIPLVVTFNCPPPVGALSLDMAVPAPWFWAEDTPRPLAADGKSFQGNRTGSSQGTVFTNTWTFTRQ
jgi:hypothetical protein